MDSNHEKYCLNSPRLEVNDLVHLSPFTKEDTTFLSEYLSDKEVSDYLMFIPFPFTKNDAEEYIEKVLSGVNKKTIVWAIRESRGRMIGRVHLVEIENNHKARVGFWLARPYWGKGITTGVIKKVCEFGFDKLNLIRFYSYVFSHNKASSRVLEKCGFEKEALLKKEFKKNGLVFDGELYGFTK